MNVTRGSAAPANGSFDDIPTYEELAADPEIAALLDFEPVPRRIEVEGGWSPKKQREFIARLAVHGSKNKACTEMGMHTTGMTKLQNSPQSKSFRAAWQAAVELARCRSDLFNLSLESCRARKAAVDVQWPAAMLAGSGLMLTWSASNATPLTMTAQMMRAFLFASATAAFCQPERSRNPVTHRDIRSLR